jgi:two-component system, NarL family, response regulator
MKIDTTCAGQTPFHIDAQLRRSRILLVSKQVIIGRALGHLLAGDKQLDVLAGVTSIEEISFATQMPDLLLVDLERFDEINDIVAIARRASPQTKIAVLTSSEAQPSLKRCVACGVDGYIVKDVLPAEFIRACKSLARGETYFDPRLAGELLRRLRDGVPAQDELSIREGEIIRLIAMGRSNKEIGTELILAEKTVKNHITRIFSKIQVTARTQAAIYAIRNGMA